MHKLIKDGVLIKNQWPLSKGPELPETQAMVSLQTWNQHHLMIQGPDSPIRERIGLWLAADDQATDILGDLKLIPVIAIRFPAFADGRGFSTGRLLRERYGYDGELRAIGEPIRDQLSYLVRVGFNAFELADHYDPAEAIKSLCDFVENYQSSVDQPTPLFRRRA